MKKCGTVAYERDTARSHGSFGNQKAYTRVTATEVVAQSVKRYACFKEATLRIPKVAAKPCGRISRHFVVTLFH